MSPWILLIVYVSLSCGLLVDQKQTLGRNGTIAFHELPGNSTTLQLEFKTLQSKYDDLEKELVFLRNLTMEMSNVLTSLGSVNFLQELQSLTDQVKSIGAKTYILDSNDRIRNQDVSVLYNRTAELDTKITNILLNTDSRIEQIEHEQNVTVQTLEKNIEDTVNKQKQAYTNTDHKLDHIERSWNETVRTLNAEMEQYSLSNNLTRDAIMKKVSEANEKVGMTACVSVDGIRRHGNVIKFDELRSHVGILDLSLIRSTGKFTCEKSGLYHISVVMNTPTPDAAFSTHVNGNEISKLSISTDHSVDTGTAVVALSLQENDILWVQADTDIHVYYRWSCMTIVKI